MATAGKIKPVLSPFEQALGAIRRGYLGPSEGEDGKVGRLVDETSECESSTKKAILAAPPTEKLIAFGSGFNEWQEKLCASATACYDECLGLAVSNQTASPAEFASSFTLECLSTFLRVTPLGRKEKAREINSKGRVRWFVRHACCDYSDDFPSSYGLRARKRLTFRLPQYLSVVWMVREKVAKRRRVEAPAIGSLSIKETGKFILDKEQTVIKSLRNAIAEAHRKALIDLGTNGSDGASLSGLTSVDASTQSLAEVHDKPAAPPNGTAKLIQWDGTDRSLADEILKQYADHQIVAASRTEALRKGCANYVRKDGTRFNPRSLWQNIKNREAEGK